MAKKLLLIEDSVSIQALVASTFEHEDVDLIVTDNAVEGLRKAQTMSPDMVLADASLPDMDGFQLCQRIRQTPDGRHIPVVLLTSSFAVYDAAKGDLAGVTTHLVKPFASQALVDLVNQCVPIVRRLTPSPPMPTPLGTGYGHAMEPDLDAVRGQPVPSILPVESEQWPDTAVELGLDAPIPTVLQDIMPSAPEACSECRLPIEDARDTQDTPFSEQPHPLPPPAASGAADGASLAFHHALGSRFEHLVRETLETHLRSALEQLMPQLLAAAHAVIAEKMPDILAGLLQQEIDKLKRAVERESDPGAPR